MNMYAFTELQRYVANEISKKIGREIKVGRYTHTADSYHLYGSYFSEISQWLEQIKTKSLDARTVNTEDVQYFLDSGKIDVYNNKQNSKIPLLENHKKRLLREIPKDRHAELKE